MKEEYNYTKYYTVEGEGGRFGLCSCLKCGATLIIGDKELDTTTVHDKWHKTLNKTISKKLE